jgi:tetratricopeptide (TPR) repeat protein
MMPRLYDQYPILSTAFNTAFRLHRAGDGDAAERIYLYILGINAHYAPALHGLGVLYAQRGHSQQALERIDRAIELDARHPIFHHHRGCVLRDLGRFDEAIASYEQAILLNPDDAQPHNNKGLCELLLGRFESGWKEHEWRLRIKNAQNTYQAQYKYHHSLWDGNTSLAGQTILLRAEQGMGDVIQFCRYVRHVAAQCNRIILAVHAPLKRLMLSLEGPLSVVGLEEPLPPVDTSIFLMSLPLVFRTTLDTIPAPIPYLYVLGRRQRVFVNHE